MDTMAELGIDLRLLVVELEGLGGLSSSSMEVRSGDTQPLKLTPPREFRWWCRCSRAWSGCRRLGRLDCWGVVAVLLQFTTVEGWPTMHVGDGEACELKKYVY